MLSRLYCISIIFLSFLLLPLVPATAQERLSSSEDVAMTFFLLAGMKPDFEEWATKSNKYKHIAPARVDRYVKEESARLYSKWINLRKEENFIRLRTIVEARLLRIEETKDHPAAQGFLISFKNGDVDYLPFHHAGYNIALVVPELAGMLEQSVGPDQFEAMTHHLSLTSDKDVSLNLKLKPEKVDASAPLMVGGEEYWILYASIVGLALNTEKTNAPLWNYGADWYVSPVKKELQSIYKKPIDPLKDANISIPAKKNTP